MPSKETLRRARQVKTLKLQKFLHTFFPDELEQGEAVVHSHMLVKYMSLTGSRVEIYEYPLHNPHGRFAGGTKG